VLDGNDSNKDRLF